MTFQPVIPFSGASGWAFLQRTEAAQREAFENSPSVQRDIEYFKENIGNVETAEDLVGDYQLMKVALGAFGLDDDLSNKAFIKKVLEEGSLDAESFANRMVDKRYLALTEAFGFDLGTPSTKLSDFADEITANFADRQFEVAVGEQNSDMRLAMALERDLGEIIDSDNTDDGKWFAVMGNEPLRQVFETAMGLPSSFAALDIDRQVDGFRKKAEAYFGDGEISQFSDPAQLEELNRLFLVRSEIALGSSGMSSGNIALTLLQSIA